MAAVALLAATSACDGAAKDADSPRSPITQGSTPPRSAGTSAAAIAPDLHASLQQMRTKEGTREITAHITNDSAGPVTVTSVQLDSPAFATLPPTPKQTVFAPGATIDLQTSYGRPHCAAGDDGSTFVLTVEGVGTQRLPVDRAGLAFLDYLHTRECGLAAAEAIATVTFGHQVTRVVRGGTDYLLGTTRRHPRG